MRFVPMTQDRGRKWGVYDMVLNCVRVPLYTFEQEADAEEAAETLNKETKQ